MSTKEVIDELKKIRTILAFSNSKIIEKKLNQIIKTKKRKEIWIYSDGTRTQTEIADLVGISQPAVSTFVNDTELANIIDNSGKGPARVIDYVPPSWVDLISRETENQVKEKEGTLDEY
jgi:hypothetical protein